jgi:hypothetical protein
MSLRYKVPSEFQGNRSLRLPFSYAAFGPATGLTIRVKQPETEHTVSISKLQSWAQWRAIRARMSGC